MGKKPSKENNLSLHKCSEEFDYEKNFPLTPKDFTLGSSKKVWWKCDKGHEWKTRINHRTKNVGCPFCCFQKPSKENNLSLHPVSKEFDLERNFPLTPENFTLGTEKKIWWKCEKKHSWKAVVHNRTRNKKPVGCPYCFGKKPSKENNLSLHKCSKEFDLERNFPLTPENFTLGSHSKVWWKCEKGHEWKTIVNKRTRKIEPTSCPECWKNAYRSKPEIELYEWCKETFPAEKIEANNRKILNGLEIDIYFSELNKGIEFNGDYYHSFLEVIKKDKRKLQEAKRKGIEIMVIWENEWNNNKEQKKKEIKKFIEVNDV